MKKIRVLLSMLAVFIVTELPAFTMACSHGYGDGKCGGGGKIAFLLLTMAVGYGVLVLSQKQTRPLDVLGRIVGGIILVVSFVGLLCTAWCGSKRWCNKSAMCDYSGGKKVCPMSLQQMDGNQPPAEPAQGN